MKFKLLLSLFVISLGASVYSKEVPSGYVFGTWEKADSPIYVNGDITIPHGQTLVIEAGVEILFRGNYQIDVQGSIIAEGTYHNKIVFGKEGTSLWKGIRYDKTHNGNAESVFRYCIIQQAHNSDLNSGNGGAFFVNAFNNIRIINSIIKDNYAENGGGGIFLQNSNIKVVNCIITRNQSFEGGGIYIKNGQPTIVNCNIIGNRLQNTTKNGAGIFNNNSYVDFINNLVFDNDVHNVGDNLTVIDNEIFEDPGFIDYENDNWRLHNNSLAINTGSSSSEILEILDEFDIYGNPRVFYNGSVDLGAAENQSVIYNQTPQISSIADQDIAAGTSVSLTASAIIGSAASGNEPLIDQSEFTITSDKSEVEITYLTNRINTNTVDFEISVQSAWSGVATVTVRVDDKTGHPNSTAAIKFNVIVDAKVPDAISADQIWSGEVVLNNHTTIMEGVTVTINPGTKILFTDRYILRVNGQIVGAGVPTDRIYFAPTEGNNKGWGSINMSDTGNAIFDYTNFIGSRDPYNCIFATNTTMNGCLFDGNRNEDLIICNNNVEIKNSIFTDNQQTGSNGTLFLILAGETTISNINVYNCSYDYFQRGNRGSIINSIIWNNHFKYAEKITKNAGIKYRNSIIDGVLKEHGASNHAESILDLDPHFTDSKSGDFTLQSVSPCINNGFTSPEQNSNLDYRGGERLQGGAIDIGAIEFMGTPENNAIVSAPAQKIDFGYANPSQIVTRTVSFSNSGHHSTTFNITLDPSSPFELHNGNSWVRELNDIPIGNNATVDVMVRLNSSVEASFNEIMEISSTNAEVTHEEIFLVGKVTTDMVFGNSYEGADTIRGNTNWCATEIRIKSDVVIDSDAILTICAGTKVIFDGNYRLTVNGQLILNGTENNKIIFTSDGNIWRSIFISNGLTKDKNTFANFVIDNADFGFWITSGDVKIENAIIKNASQAINFSNNRISEPSEIYRSKIVNNRYGIIFWYGNISAKIENTLLAKNLDAVTYHLYSANEEQDAYLFCTFSDNTRHITTTGAYHGVSSINNSLFYNGDLPYPLDELSTWGNNFRDFSDGSPRMVKSGDFEYRFNSNSPCFNAGDPSVNAGEKDIDGNPRVFDDLPDIGAFEYSNRETIDNQIEIEDIELYEGFNEYILDIPTPNSSWWNNVEVILTEENDILTANYNGGNAIKLVEGSRAGKTKVTLSSHPDNSSILFECSFYVTVKEKTDFSGTIEDVVLNEGFGEHLINISHILTYDDMQKANISVQTDSPHLLKVDFKQAKETLRILESGTGRSQILLTATINGESIFQSFHVHVLEAENSAPQVVSPITDKIFGEGFCSASINIRNVFVDEDPEDYLVYEVYSQNESIVQVFENNGQLFILEKGLGDTNIVLLATDSKGAIAENAFNISIIEGNGSISGTVTANQSFPQLSIGLTQQSASKSANTQGIRVLLIQEQTNLEIQRSVTNSEGEFIFSNIPYGDYYIGFDLPGFTVIDTYYLTISATELQITDLKYGVNFNSETITDVPELFEKAAIQIYPNPTKGKVNIEIDRAVTAGSIKLYNTHGSKLREDRLNNLPNGYLHNWNLSDLPPAIYWISVELDGTEYTEKIVLQ